MNDDQLLLASAYLDGDVDGAERARAEADLEVMAEVARMRTVRAAMRDVGAPDPDRRERAVAAALATLADEPAPVVAPTPPAARARRRRRAPWGGVLAAAAALVLVVAAGIVLRGTSSGDDDDAGSLATEATLGDASRSAAEQAPGATSGAAAPAPAAEEDADVAADGQETTSAEAPRTQLAEVGAELRTPADLAAFATSRRGQPYQGPAPTCAPGGTFLGPVVFAGVGAEVFEVDTSVTALDASTCAVLATVER